ncbi:E3 ubiquitin-protein ligase RNF25 isoform X2 [Latimeria chalumnae]|uniref:E3 ubiquitin-protein ligase RNF25 isoform X2 n=1 Tax=Latimeria chalumnae TaxID=7897 RepID=UPI00313DADDC
MTSFSMRKCLPDVLVKQIGECRISDERSGAVASEMEVLEAIYLDELHVSYEQHRSQPWEVSITLYPATAEDQTAQYVRFTLCLALPPQYPDAVPQITVRNPRGLSDENIQSIQQCLMRIAESGVGAPILYELIEKGKEILTNNNVPYCQCVICLHGFQQNEAFTKTSCYHYFHSHCLARYIQHMEEEIEMQKKEMDQNRMPTAEQELKVICPVCREPLTYDLPTLLLAPPPQLSLEAYVPDEVALQRKQELRRIYERQRARGGIIDPEAESKRFFISLQQTSNGIGADESSTSAQLSTAKLAPENSLGGIEGDKSSTSAQLSTAKLTPENSPGGIEGEESSTSAQLSTAKLAPENSCGESEGEKTFKSPTEHALGPANRSEDERSREEKETDVWVRQSCKATAPQFSLPAGRSGFRGQRPSIEQHMGVRGPYRQTGVQFRGSRGPKDLDQREEKDRGWKRSGKYKAEFCMKPLGDSRPLLGAKGPEATKRREVSPDAPQNKMGLNADNKTSSADSELHYSATLNSSEKERLECHGRGPKPRRDRDRGKWDRPRGGGKGLESCPRAPKDRGTFRSWTRSHELGKQNPVSAENV